MVLSFITHLALLVLFGALSVSALPSRPDKRDVTPIPAYALQYAPWMHLHSEEAYWPSDIAEHLQHTTPKTNFTTVVNSITVETLSTLSPDVYLTSNDVIDTNPDWLTSIANIPDSTGYSTAPGTIIAVQKEVDNATVVDIFYFHFCSFDLGNTFLGTDYGNHVGDWEHQMIRFQDGNPTYLYLSAHGAGGAYNFSAIPTTVDGRPITYIANHTHANYVTSGNQDYSLPFGLLKDVTDNGPAWDFTQNYRGFWFDNSTQTFTSAGGARIGGDSQEAEGVSWLYWKGKWGDKQYPDDDPDVDQYCVDIGSLNECHYVDGPTGPIAKVLGRSTICQNNDPDNCDISDSV